VTVGLQVGGPVEQGAQLVGRKLIAGEEVTRHPGIVVRALSWNLFHGRDHPPDDDLFTLRSRLLRMTERNATHVQVNRPLEREFGELLGRLEWDVALLQEVPPAWLRPLCRAAGASGASALTSRNQLALLRRAIARLNPDLIASNEGGSNQVLARPPWRIAEVRRHTLTRRPERRRMIWVLLRAPDGARLAVANLHATTGGGDRTRAEVREAASLAVEWAGQHPLVFGGDLNLRPRQAPREFAELRSGLGLDGDAPGDAIDFLLARGLRPLGPRGAAHAELPAGDGRALRLSDHAYVTAAFEVE
jgi:endonuclease/exonuclease/phosphatase family metal-dependent hydrolase